MYYACVILFVPDFTHRGGARERVSLMHFYTIFYVYNLA
jgi:hypothetical protein